MTEFNYELFDDRVVIQPDPTEEKTSSGLFIAKSAQRNSSIGTVIAIGKGTVAPDTGVLIEMFVKEGDRVKYEPHGFEPFEGFMMGRQSSIVCRILTSKEPTNDL